MATIRFQKFLNRYGIKALVVGTPDIVPGSIIERRNRGYFKFSHLEKVLGGSKQSWDVALQPANLVYGTVERTLSLSGRTSLNEFGVTIEGGLGRVNSVKFEIKEVKARSFVDRDKLTLVQEIFDYRKLDRRKWNRLLNDKWVADYTYYATRIVFYFDTATGVDIRADTKDKITVASAGGSFKWGSKGRLVVTTTDEVPFGFSGWKL
jgi:hypothetical protein